MLHLWTFNANLSRPRRETLYTAGHQFHTLMVKLLLISSKQSKILCDLKVIFYYYTCSVQQGQRLLIPLVEVLVILIINSYNET